jgi:hypothetical protein
MKGTTMYKMMLLTAALALSGAAAATAQSFKMSDPNSIPEHRVAEIDRTVTAGVAMERTYNGYNAADDFRVSND